MTLLIIFACILLVGIILIKPIYMDRYCDIAAINRLLKDSGKRWSIIDSAAKNISAKENQISVCWLNVPFIIFSRAITNDNIHIKRWLFCFRFHANRIIKMIDDEQKPKPKETIDLYLMGVHLIEKLSNINIAGSSSKPLIDKELYSPIEDDIIKIKNGKINKTGMLLYGPPGNGKSYLIRHLATKYEIPIVIVSMGKNVDNMSLLQRFNELKGPAVILFEDFDCMFDKRDRDNKNNPSDITLDGILNLLDGTHCQLDRAIICMTANDIERIDTALKWRPSRLKFVREIPNPPRHIRAKIFDDDNLIEATDGLSLDECLAIKDRGEEAMEEIVNQRHSKEINMGFGSRKGSVSA